MSSQGTTNSVSEFKPPEYTQQPWQDYVNAGTTLAQQGLPQYQGQTVADRNFTQQTAADMGYNLATAGSPVYNAGQASLASLLGGGTTNPYASMANPYLGDNPYLQSVIDKSNNDITSKYQTGTAAQLDSAAAMKGAFGGSAYGQAVDANQKTLADALANNTSNLRYQNYGNSANLAEQGLSRASQGYAQGIGQQLQAASLAPQYEATDWAAINNLNSLGGEQRGYQQQLLDAAQQAFGNYVSAPWQNLDLLGSVLSRASGNAGSTSSSVLGGAYSPLATVGGLGALGYGLFGGK